MAYNPLNFSLTASAVGHIYLYTEVIYANAMSNSVKKIHKTLKGVRASSNVRQVKRVAAGPIR